jgi:predicted aminopeptidase
VIFNFPTVLYGINQLQGQLNIVMKARPVQEVIADPAVSDSVKLKFAFIEKVKRYAIDSLGLKETKNYTTFYDQGGKPLLWVITACEPFKIEAYEWKFPLLGSVSYKGYFDYEKGKEEEKLLIEKGFDTDYSEVTAWSTLGWFKDPILSGMLRRSKGQLAELIIHEMTHAAIYIKSNVNLNENLASVCGEEGAIRFLRFEYGAESNEVREYINRKADNDRFSSHMIAGSQKLDSLYSVIMDLPAINKKTEKDRMLRAIVGSLDTVSFHNPDRYKNAFRKNLPNNAYFIDFIRYDAQKDEMRIELMENFNGNIREYIKFMKEKHS